jgi:hypothetical protein
MITALQYIGFIKSTRFSTRKLARNNQLLTNKKNREHDSKSTYSLCVRIQEGTETGLSEVQRAACDFSQHAIGTGTAL